MAVVVYYKPEQWPRLLEMSADRETLEPTYEEWESNVEQKARRLRENGVSLGRVDVDVDELLAWCKSEGRPVDGAARAAYVTNKLSEQHPGSNEG
jgi:hypothetical protein